jgi:hypothetical protein
LARWKKMTLEAKRHGWLLRGWFHGISCIGGIAGAIMFSARIVLLTKFYTGRKMDLISEPTPSEKQLVLALRRDSAHAAAVVSIFLPLDLAFVIIAQLLVLHRLQSFAIDASQRRVWDAAGRVFLAAVILVSIVGFCSNIVSAYHYNASALFNNGAMVEWAANNSASGVKKEFQAYISIGTAARIGSVQRFCEVLLVLSVILAFCIVGIKSSAVMSSALRTLFTAKKKLEMVRLNLSNANSNPMSAHSNVDEFSAHAMVSQEQISNAAEQGQQLQRKVFWTVSFVFSTVIVRSVLNLMYAFSQAFQDGENPCSFNPCNQCRNVYSHIDYWIVYSPVFFSVVMLISSPLALLVALWGMSNVKVLEQMTSAKARLNMQWRNFRNNRSSPKNQPAASAIPE